MSELLPPSAERLERAIAEAAGDIERVPVVIREIWDPDTCPANVLPWLAWAFSIDDWDDNWSEQHQRDSIRVAIVGQRHKGSIGAVRNALGALGIEARVQEWFAQKPSGTPYTFWLWLEAEQTPVTTEGIEQALKIIERLKSLRSHLNKIQVRATSRTRTRVATVTNLGAEVTIAHFTGRPLVVNEGALAMPHTLMATDINIVI